MGKSTFGKSTFGKLVLSPFFGSGMVFQNNAAFPVWGRSEPDAEINVTLKDEKKVLGIAAGRADKEGKWKLTLDPVKAGGPFSMEINAADERIFLENIYSGFVWLCAGQSNMELTMQRLQDNYPEEWIDDEYPVIRQFKVPQEWDFTAARDELSSGSWVQASKQTLQQFSGTAWFFAKKLWAQYGIPIGLISTAWGGTPVEAWMSREALSAFPEKLIAGSRYADQKLCAEITTESENNIRQWTNRITENDRGLKEEWQKPETETGSWNVITLPGNFAENERPDLDGFCGSIWLCREFEACGEITGSESKVWLGTIIDADTVYINGKEIGNTTYRYPPRKYLIPKGLLNPGRNRISIRVICNNGQGCVTPDKPFKIFSDKAAIQLEGKWKYRIGVKTPLCPEAFYFQRQPMGPFNAMIAPVLRLPLTGVIWYQGESNDRSPDNYADLFRSMISDWRKKNRGDLPFLFVQLPIYGEGAENDESSPWARIREAQASCLSLPYTGMAAALDLGEWNDLHPLNKKDVGGRLFLAAEKTVFDCSNTSPGPQVQDVKRNANTLKIKFSNCGTGLCSNAEPYVTAVNEDGRQKQRLSAKIEGEETLVIDISKVTDSGKILYAWANNPKDRQLTNSEGLPVIPFRIIVPNRA